MKDAENDQHLPETGGIALAFFRRQFPRFLRKNFGRVWMEKGSLERIRGISGGAIIFLNHPSWWDPVSTFTLAHHLFPGSRHFGPIDAKAIERYGFMRKIGLFGIDGESGRGLRDFVRIGRAVAASRDAFLWVTPQGEFCDTRLRPVRLKPGLGHLAARARAGRLLPLAVEYVLGDERWPDLFLRFGDPIPVGEEGGPDAEAWTRVLESALESCQDQLAAPIIQRRLEAFVPLFEGRRGTGGIYGWWQKLSARLRGEKFDPRHASIDEEKGLQNGPAT